MASERRRLAAGAVRPSPAEMIGRILFPHFCLGCGLEGKILCDQCQQQESAPLRGVFLCPACGRPSPFGAACPGACRRRSAVDGVISMAPYGHPLFRDLIHEYKYGGIEEAGAVIEGIFVDFLRARRHVVEAIVRSAVVTAVPIHYFRRARRGFNQSERLAAAVGRIFAVQASRDVLRRRFQWKSQVDTGSAGSRFSNAADTVICRAGQSVGGRCIVVDDVMTTGATLQACALALKATGFSEVWGMTLLRG